MNIFTAHLDCTSPYFCRHHGWHVPRCFRLLFKQLESPYSRSHRPL